MTVFRVDGMELGYAGEVWRLYQKECPFGRSAKRPAVYATYSGKEAIIVYTTPKGEVVMRKLAKEQ